MCSFPPARGGLQTPKEGTRGPKGKRDVQQNKGLRP